jgi:hypothetical protein
MDAGLGMIEGGKMVRWGEREQSEICFGTACLWEIWWAGRAKSLNVPTVCCLLGRSERRAAHVPHDTRQSRPWRSPHTSPRCVVQHCDDTCIQCCATCMRAVRMKPVPINVQRHPCSYPTIDPGTAHVEARVPFDQARDMRTLVCPPGQASMRAALSKRSSSRS